MKQSVIDEFAKKQGYDKAEYLGKWRGYRCYEPILNDGADTAFVGLPLLILVDERDKIRMSTPEEAMKQLEETE